MKNRWYPVISLFLLIALVSTGCSVSGSKYDAMAVELDLVKQDRQALQTQLQEAQSQIIDARTDTVKAQVTLELTQTNLARTQEQLQTAQSDLQALQAQFQAIQSQLTVTGTDLQNAQVQVKSLQNDLNTARIIPAQALSYAEFMDILMYEIWILSGVTPKYTFSSAGEYTTALKNRAAAIGDANLLGFVAEMEAGPVNKNRLYIMCYYCLDKVEAILK